jgi:hypothetical protein
VNVVSPKGPSHYSSNTNTISKATVAKIAIWGFVILDLVLAWVGFTAWPELTWLSLGVVAYAWATNIAAPFTRTGSKDNLPTRVAKMARALASLSAPIVAAVVVNTPVSYQQGASVLACLLGASSVLGYMGKALKFKEFLISLLMSVAIGVVAYALPEPPRTEPPPSLEHNPNTDVKLVIRTILPEGRTEPLFDVSHTCFAILPSTWFQDRPLVYLGIAIQTMENERQCEVPYSPLGYVVEYQEGRNPGVEVEVKGLLPGATSDVVIAVAR